MNASKQPVVAPGTPLHALKIEELLGEACICRDSRRGSNCATRLTSADGRLELGLAEQAHPAAGAE
jgi:hypothetical protein